MLSGKGAVGDLPNILYQLVYIVILHFSTSTRLRLQDRLLEDLAEKREDEEREDCAPDGDTMGHPIVKVLGY